MTDNPPPPDYDRSRFGPCGSCGKVIARGLVRCPHCGEDTGLEATAQVRAEERYELPGPPPAGGDSWGGFGEGEGGSPCRQVVLRSPP